MEPDEATIEAMRRAASVLRSVTSSVHDEARALRLARDAADAALSQRLAEIESTAAYVHENASSTVTWARRELNLEAGQTKALIAASASAAKLPAVGEAFAAGEISLDHMRVLTFSLEHVGEAHTVKVDRQMATIARAFPLSRLRALVREAKAVHHPEKLDEAWIKGMAKRDITVSPTLDGWHVNGFLPTDVGAQFKAVLRALSTPRAGGDDRTAAQRRCDGLGELLASVLAAGLPTDGTVAPQIHVIVDAGTLKAALAPDPDAVFTAGPPADLVGFGPIGPQLLRHLTEGAALTPILVERIGRNEQILDVGRAHRLATRKQRHALWYRQRAECARPGCHNGIDHSHHTVTWLDGGRTDLDDLEGLCASCHRHHHAREPRAG